MRKILTFLVLFVFVTSFNLPNQERNTYNMPIDTDTGKITYSKVVDEAGTSGELFDRAYDWAKKYFVNISSTIKTRDKENGILTGSTRFKVQSTDKKGRKVDAGVIMYDFTIEFKENKYRVVETNFVQANNSGNGVEEWFDDTNEKAIPIHKEIFEQIDKEAKQMISSLVEGMKPVKKSTDEW